MNFKEGEQVFISSHQHPWCGERGEVVAYEKYRGIKIRLRDGRECYAPENDLKRVI